MTKLTLSDLQKLMNETCPDLERAAFDAAMKVAADDKGVDIHQLTASLVFGVEPKDVTLKQRMHAKHRNFVLLYGGRPKVNP